jgi:hypothetical protein
LVFLIGTVPSSQADWTAYFAPLAALIAAQLQAALQAHPPDVNCTIEEWFRPVKLGGVDTGYNHTIIRTIVDGAVTTYEGEPDPSPAVPPICDPTKQACPTNSLLVGVTTNNPQATQGLGTFKASISGIDVCAKIVAIGSTNAAYNFHKLHYVINGAPNSNSYAYTLLLAGGLLTDGSAFGPPPDTPGWGYNVITNPAGYH